MSKWMEKRWFRFVFGLVVVIIILVAGFSMAYPAIQRWGATDAEVAARLPGDELLNQPLVWWTHAETIDAPVEQVWPWVAQLGDRKAGFYSYTFIENLVAGGDIYHNANVLLPAFQDPQVGDDLIGGQLKIREVVPDVFLLGAPVSDDFGWTWLWYLTPLDSGHTRLAVHMGIQVPALKGNPVVTFVMNVGGFVMENNMLQGLKLRAEGGSEPADIEVLEIVLWMAALLIGLAGAVLYMRRQDWVKFLAVGAAAVILLMALTLVQPAIWMRGALDLALLGGLAWAAWPVRRTAHILAQPARA